MAKQVIIVRHGESIGNAGARTENTLSTPLSGKGFEQAEAVVELLPIPDAVIFSTYLRTQQTAAPLLKKHDHITPEEWGDIRELSMLSRNKYPNTTEEERRIPRDLFWEQNDPYFHDDETAESFLDFFNRGQATIERLRDHTSSTVIVFSHDVFIQLLQFLHDEKEFIAQNQNTEEGLKQIMNKFNEKRSVTKTPNATPIDISYIIENQ